MIRLIKKKKNIQIPTKEQVLDKNAHHQWILSDRSLYRFFKEVLHILNHEDFLKLNQTKKLCFLYSPGQFASALPSDKEYNFVILYFEMIKLIKSVDNSMAFAIIFHELGHLFYEHHKEKKSSIEKQCEADSFAFKYGFGREILEFLYTQNSSLEVKTRISSMKNLLICSRSH